MYKRLYNLVKTSVANNLPVNEMKFICIYRCFSLLLTSLIYLTDRYKASMVDKIAVIGCLTIAVILLNYIYSKNENEINIVKALIILELIGNIAILMPTGGLNSPYVWYSLNTVLVMAYYLNLSYFCMNIITYVVCSLIISFTIFNIPRSSLINYLLENSNLILSYLLIVIAIKSMMRLEKKLREESRRLILTNNELAEANKIIDESMEHFTALYQSIHILTNVKNTNELVKIMARYTKEITKSHLAFIAVPSEEDECVLEVSNNISDNFYNILIRNIKQEWGTFIDSENTVKCSWENRSFLVVTIKSSYESYGILGIELTGEYGKIIRKEIVSQVKFLASLTSILLERIKIDEVNKLLLLAEEQNRIANEIHDSVSQRLFFISSKLYSLMEGVEIKKPISIKSELRLVLDSLNSSMKELRKTIYSYSDKRSGSSMFEEKIRNYMDEISMLNDVSIKLYIKGSLELISYELKRVLYRILCEALGNAIRHGKSRNIDIRLAVNNENINLVINDDGIGFDTKNKSNMGLGIKNLHNLVYSFGGEIIIKSQLHKGTCINIQLPSESIVKQEQGEVII